MRQTPGQPAGRLTPARGSAFQLFLVAAAVLGLGLGLAFGGGVLYGRRDGDGASAAQPTAAAGAAGARTPGAGGAAGAGAPTTGVVESIAGDTVTIRTSAGGPVQIKLVADTQIRQTVGATAADIRPGNTLVVTGQPDVDGKVAARTVQISPPGGPGGGTPGAGRPGGTSGAGGAPGGGRPGGSPTPAP